MRHRAQRSALALTSGRQCRIVEQRPAYPLAGPYDSNLKSSHLLFSEKSSYKPAGSYRVPNSPGVFQAHGGGVFRILQALDRVEEILLDQGRVCGIRTSLDERVSVRAVIVATGTFLNGLVHVGLKHFAAGRLGDFPATELAQWFKALGFAVGRLKTGTAKSMPQ